MTRCAFGRTRLALECLEAREVPSVVAPAVPVDLDVDTSRDNTITPAD